LTERLPGVAQNKRADAVLHCCNLRAGPSAGTARLLQPA